MSTHIELTIKIELNNESTLNVSETLYTEIIFLK